MRPLATTLFALITIGRLVAQDPAALQQREADLKTTAVAGLHELADAYQAEKQHLQALHLRRRIWMDYDENDKRSREKTGFVQIGSLWRIDADALVLDRDLKGKKSKIRKLDKSRDKLQEQLLAEHRELAAGWGKVGNQAEAARHWQRVLRIEPGDPEAARALALREFEGFTGTEQDVRMLRRGRTIHLASDWLVRASFPVEVLKERRLPLLEAAGVEHVGVRTEFFTVWGSLPVEELETIAQDCERTLLLAKTLFGVSTGTPFRAQKKLNLVFVRDQNEYAAMLDVCRDQFSDDRMQFLLSLSMSFLQHGGEQLRAYKGDLGIAVSRDMAVRGVMQDATGVDTDGLWEGIGHMACGFLFKQTLTFLEEQLKERTSAGHTERRLSPDMETWMRIAQESAWSKSDTRTSQLVLIKAAKFTTEQRVKAWAICHYFAHWRPQYILTLDACKTEVIRSPPDVEAEFLRRTKYELPRIDMEWRNFWARGTELRAAMTRDPLPNEKAKNRKAIERMQSLVDAINQARAAARIGPVGWYLDATPDFAAVRDYEKALVRAEREQAKRRKKAKPGREIEPVEFPKVPAALGNTVLWSRRDEPADVVEQWLADPLVRGKLLHPGRGLFAVPSDKGSFLLGIAFPPEQAKAGEPLPWPRHGQSGVPGAVALTDVGADVRQLAEAEGYAKDGKVGLPLSLHFAREVEQDVLAGVTCRVFEGNVGVDGKLLVDAGNGTVAFVPSRPWQSGQDVEVRWRVPIAVMGKDRQMAPLTFSTR